MRQFLLLLVTFFCMQTQISAQGDIEAWSIKRTKKDGRDSTKEIIRLNDSGYFQLKKLPQIIEIVYHDVLAPTGEFIINKGSGQFTLSFKSSSRPNIQISDLQNATLRLRFLEGKLIAIGNRVLEDPIEITGKEPTIRFKNFEPKVTTIDVPKSPFQRLSSTPDNNCFLTLDNLTKLSLFTCAPIECCKGKPMEYSQPDLNYFNNRYQSDGAPGYLLTVNAQNGSSSILRYDRGKGSYTIVENPRLRVKSKILVSVVGTKDTTYVIDSNFTSLYLSADSSFIKSLAGLGILSTEKDSEGKDTAKSDSLMGIKSQELRSPLFELYYLKNMLITLNKVKHLSGKDFNALDKKLAEVFKESDSLLKKIDSLNENIETLKEKISSLRNDNLTTLLHLEKGLLMSLLKSLEQFNFTYRDINFREHDYLQSLHCLKFKIEDIFSIPVNFNAEDLANQLSFRILRIYNSETAKCYHKDLANVIEKIAEQYKAAIAKNTTLAIYSRPVFVKNEDLLKITIKRNDGKSIFQHEFDTRGGLKLDVSTGMFVTGLRDNSYTFIDSTVWYRRDSSGYTPSSGNLYDTTGRIVIQEEDSRSRIGLGVLFHAYPRISRYVNLGLSVGFLTTVNIDLNLMTGFSLMLGQGRRILLSGGAIWGKVNTLSAAYKPGVNRYSGNLLKPEDGNYAKPIFYNTPGGAVPTTSVWTYSYFFGVSWNLTAK